LIILIIFSEDYKLWSSSLCSFLQYPVTSSFFDQNIILSTLLCEHPQCQRPSFASHPYRSTGKIIVLNILIFMFLDSKREDRIEQNFIYCCFCFPYNVAFVK
jgi:hypothetical protein